MKDLFVQEYFDAHKALKELSVFGATSARILDEDFRVALLEEAEGYNYKPEDEIVGSRDKIVNQQVSSFDQFSDRSNYILLKDSWKELLEWRLTEFESHPFESAVSFDSMVLQRYEKGSMDQPAQRRVEVHQPRVRIRYRWSGKVLRLL